MSVGSSRRRIDSPRAMKQRELWCEARLAGTGLVRAEQTDNLTTERERQLPIDYSTCSVRGMGQARPIVGLHKASFVVWLGATGCTCSPTSIVSCRGSFACAYRACVCASLSSPPRVSVEERSPRSRYRPSTEHRVTSRDGSASARHRGWDHPTNAFTGNADRFRRCLRRLFGL